MDKTILGDTLGSWLKWAVGLIAIWFTIKNYLNENRTKLSFLITDDINTSITVKDKKEIHNDNGVTIKVINSGRKTTKIKYLGIGKNRSKLYILMHKIFRNLYSKSAYTKRLRNPFKLEIHEHTINEIFDKLVGQDPYRLIHALEDTEEYQFDINGLSVRLSNFEMIKQRMNKNKLIKFSFYFQSFDGNLYQKKMVIFKDQQLYKYIEQTLLQHTPLK